MGEKGRLSDCGRLGSERGEGEGACKVHCLTGMGDNALVYTSSVSPRYCLCHKDH